MAGVAAPEFVTLMAAVVAGGVIQGSLGFGFALVVVPALALVASGSVPATALFLAAPMTIFMALRERRHIDVAGFLSITVGRLFGTLGGVWVLLSISSRSLSVVVGALLITVVGLSVVRLRVEPGRMAVFGAGLVAGVTGTTTAIGGPALAVVYQSRPGPELRSTLALSFVAGQVLSLSGLLVAGKVHGWHAVLALELVPALALGLWASRPIARYLDARWLRPAVLAFAALAGVTIVARGLLGA